MPTSLSRRQQHLSFRARVRSALHPIPLIGYLFTVSALASAFAPAQTSSPSPATIHGTVLNSVTREPIPRALVTSQDDRFGVLTDDQGNFSFTFPTHAKSFSGAFHAGKPGFLEDDGSNVSASISRAAPPDLVFTLTPEALITGRVRLPSAGSFDSITVELYRRDVSDGRAHWTPAGNERARSNGDFRFAGLAAGTYKIFTSEMLDRDPSATNPGPDSQQFGYPPAYFPTASDFSSAAPILLTAGQTFQVELTPTLRPYYPIRISLPNLPPGVGINVFVAPANHRGPGFSLGYDVRTQTIAGMLPSGTYTVEAVSYGQIPAAGLLTITVNDAPLLTPTLLLNHGQNIPVNFRKEFSAREDGSASSSRPISGRNDPVNITLTPADDFSSRPSANLAESSMAAPGIETTSPRLTAVPPGLYWLRIYGSLGYAASATSAGADLLLNPLVVGPGGAPAPIDITLRDDTAEIEGVIEDSSPDKRTASREPAVYCVPLPDSTGNFVQAGIAISLEDVRFQCLNLPPGSYRILAFEHSQPEFEYRNPDAMRPFESKGPVVRVAGGQKETVRVSLNP
jgi:hypothetical protein